MQHIIPIDLKSFPEGFHSRRIVGPKTASGIETCTIILSRVPVGCHGPELHTHPVDQFYYVVSGEIELQLGDEKFMIGPDTLVAIPAGTPHCNVNKGSVDEFHVEVLAPAVPADQVSVIPAKPRHIENAKDLIRKVSDIGFTTSRSGGFRTAQLARRSMGSDSGRIYLGEVDPGGGGPKLHFHEFDQFYFVLKGELEIQIGLGKHKAGPNTLVVLPAGTVHSQRNIGKEVERHITMLIPEPRHNGRLDHVVQIVEDD